MLRVYGKIFLFHDVFKYYIAIGQRALQTLFKKKKINKYPVVYQTLPPVVGMFVQITTRISCRRTHSYA